MAYFLKTSHYKKGDYIQIYYSFRDPETRKPRNKCYKTLGYIEDLKAQGIADPVSYYKKQIELLNDERRKKKNPAHRTISNAGASRNIGYFPAQMYWNVLNLDDLFRPLLQGRTRYNAAKCFHDLVMARFSDLFFLRKDTWTAVHALYQSDDWSREELQSCLEFLGSHSDEIVEALHPTLDSFSSPEWPQRRQYLGLSLYYLESAQQKLHCDERLTADKNDNLMIPSRIMIGMSLDEHLIPSGFRFVPDPSENEIRFSEAAPLSCLVSDERVKKIRVADKLLNDPEELHDAIKNHEGYLFARNMNSLPVAEEEWLLGMDEAFKQKKLEEADLSFYGTNRISPLYENSASDYVLLKSDISFTPYTYLNKEAGDPVSFSSQEKILILYSESRAAVEKRKILQQMDQASQLLRTGASEADFQDAGRYISRDPKTSELIFNQNQAQKDLKKAGCQIIVTTQLDLDAEKILSIYGELWRVKEILKNQKLYLDRNISEAKSRNTLKGSVLVCFIALILDRLARLDLLEDRFLPFDFDQFVDNFLVVEKLPGVCINLTEPSEILQFIERKTGLALSSYELDQKQIQKMLQAKPVKTSHLSKKTRSSSAPD